MKKQIISLIILALLPIVSSAETVEIDGVHYNLVAKVKSAEVKSNPNKYSGVVVIPETVVYNGVHYRVTSIGDYAFLRCSGLTSITIGNSVNSIGRQAFEYCTSLASITIPDSVTSIGSYAFGGCSFLKNITIGNYVTSIGDNAFYGCSGLTSVHISDLSTWCKISFDDDISNPLIFAHRLYLNGEEIKDLVIPNSVTSIGEYAFQECSGLTSVTIPNSVTNIGPAAFSGCSGLTSVTIPNSVTSIGDGAFLECSGLTNITIGNSVIGIGQSAFNSCSGLTNITIGNSVASIGDNAFINCCRLTNVTIPNSVTNIGRGAFANCSGLKSVTIPSSVTSIGKSAFSGCNGLTSVTIASGVKTIDGYAFAYCPELTDVYCYAEIVPSTNSDAFSGSLIEYATLHVPAASVNGYMAAEPWKNFKAVVATDGTPHEVKKCATPVISYKDGKLTFTCETEGAEFVSEVTVADAKKYYTSEVNLGTIYKVSVVAMKTGYDNSDPATMEINVSGPGAGPVGDLNKDSKVDATDLTKLIDILLKRQ